jgi:hypothetical protein
MKKEYRVQVHVVLNKRYYIDIEAENKDQALDFAAGEVYSNIDPLEDMDIYPEIVNE